MQKTNFPRLFIYEGEPGHGGYFRLTPFVCEYNTNNKDIRIIQDLATVYTAQIHTLRWLTQQRTDKKLRETSVLHAWLILIEEG